MAQSDETRSRILDVAAQLFAEHGFAGTKVDMVAKAAGVSRATVRRLTGGRTQLFEEVMAARVTSSAAQRVAAAVESPGDAPPMSVILAAAREVFANPETSWDVLELEALTRAHRSEPLRDIESARMKARWDNAAALIAQVRATGGLDAEVSDRAIVQLAIALSAGLALLDPVTEHKPSMGEWIGLMARVGTAIAPQDMVLQPDYAARQYWRVRVNIPERPGAVARAVRSLSSVHAYVVAVQVVEKGEDHRTLDIALTAPAAVTAETLRATALSVGTSAQVGEGSPHDALDLPTRVLDSATALLTAPELAPLSAAELVGADAVEVTDATKGADDSPNVLRLQWTPERHVVLTRQWAPFARAERSRASALLRLSSAVASVTGTGEATGWVEQIRGGSVWIRLARPEDADAVAAMHDRCSQRSLYQRYFAITQWHGTKLYRLSGGHRGATLVVMSEEGSIVGLGNVFPDASAGGGAAEVALILEDAFQGRGIGRKLLQALVRFAVRLKFTEIVAEVLAENSGMLHLLRTTGLEWTTQVQEGIAHMRAPLPESSAPVEVQGLTAEPGDEAPSTAPPGETPVKRSPAKKASAKKTPAKKASDKPAKKAPAKKAVTRKAASARTGTKSAAPKEQAQAPELGDL